MKCKKCGKKITHKDSYCGECGEEINQKEYREKQRKKIIKSIIIVGIVCIFLTCLSMVTLHVNSPRYIALKYFNTVASSDTDKIYNYIKGKESLFVSENILKEKDSLQKNIEDVSITRIYENQNKTYVEFSYTLNGKNTISYVELKKKKIFNILDTYEVISGKVSSNIEFVVPKNSTVTIDEKDISSYLQKDKTSQYDTYYIKDMIKGDYTIEVTFANGLKIKKDISVEDGRTYKIIDVCLTKEQEKQIETKSITSLNLLSEAALTNKDYSAISSSFQQDIGILYKSIKRNITNKEITALKYTDCEIKDTYINHDGNVEVSLLVDYSYTYKSEVEGTKTKETSHFITLTYVYQNDTFLLTN